MIKPTHDTTAKQQLLGCSCCSSFTDINLLGCCLVLNCQDCLKKHQCQSVISILPLSVCSQVKSNGTKKCSRCSKTATLKCQQCKGKMYCSECSKAIHKNKYAIHAVHNIAQQKIQKSAQTPRSGKKALVLEESRSPRNSHQQIDKQNKSSRQSFNAEELDNKLNLKLIETTYFKQQIKQKWVVLQNQIKNSFEKMKVELETKEKDVLASISQVKKLQLESIEKMVQNINVSMKSLKSLVYIAENQPSLGYLPKSKKVHILQDIKRIDKKISILQGIQYKYLQGNVSALSTQINNLNIFSKTKFNNQKAINSTSTITQTSQRYQRLQSKSINKKSIPLLLKKTSSTVISINTPRSAIQSPKHSINNSLHSSRFHKKNYLNTGQNSPSEYSSPPKYQKVQALKSSYKSYFDPNKLEECRSSKRLGSRNFVASSPTKYSKMKI